MGQRDPCRPLLCLALTIPAIPWCARKGLCRLPDAHWAGMLPWDGKFPGSGQRLERLESRPAAVLACRVWPIVTVRGYPERRPQPDDSQTMPVFLRQGPREGTLISGRCRWRSGISLTYTPSGNNCPYIFLLVETSSSPSRGYLLIPFCGVDSPKPLLCQRHIDSKRNKVKCPYNLVLHSPTPSAPI